MLPVLYRIRNGKGWATEAIEYNTEQKKEARKVSNIILNSIVGDIKKNVEGKKVYIPSFIDYGLPATEKQFTDNFPSGTYISVPDDLIVGIHWQNVDQNRIDLDLSLVEMDNKIGWDGDYRTSKRDVLFSGDMTDAPKGASELFYVKKQPRKVFILFVNYYNYSADIEVPFKILVAEEKVGKLKMNYMVNPNNVLAIAKSRINQKQKMLGLLVTSESGNRFYFAETNVGKSITSRNNKYSEYSRKYLSNFYENSISIRDLLVRTGAKITDSKEESDIDLSPEILEKDSILNLLR